MVMFMQSQSHRGGVIVNPYIGNIAQELHFLTGQNEAHFKTGLPQATQ